MFSYGVADFLLKKPSEKIGPFPSLVLVTLFANILALPVALIVMLKGFPRLDFIDLAIIPVLVLFDQFAFWNFLKGMTVGELALVAPVSSAWSAVTVILGVIFLKEVLSGTQAFAIALIIIGLILVSTDLRKIRHIHTIKGLGNAILAFLSWGLFVFLTDIAVSRVSSANNVFYGAVMTSFMTGILSVIVFSVLAFARGSFKGIKLNREVIMPLLIVGILFKMTWMIASFGFTVGYVTLLTPIIALSPAITVLLSMKFLKEKLVFNQKIGVLIVLGGLFLISF